MLTILVAASFVIAAVAALVSLADSTVIAQQAAAELSHERALARMGFLQQVTARELRLRTVQPRRAAQRSGMLMQATRARALPLRFAAQPGGAA